MNFNAFDLAKIDPYMTNGMMIKGSEKIEKIGFGVSASIELFKLAKVNNCQAIIVHHSFNFPQVNRYDQIFQNRISFLTKNEISLFGYHFLLDAHPEIGNNVSILKTIGAQPEQPFLHHSDPWGFTGIFKKAKRLTAIKESLKSYLSPRSVYYDFGPKEINKVVAVSGKGAPMASDMTSLLKDDVGLFITGEVHEWNRELFREAGINLIAGGHYHTECFGIKALMEKIKKDLRQITPIWLDLQNEI